MELISISHLYKSYDSKNQHKEVLKDISLSLPMKGMVFISGKSGCGKSTLLSIIGGIEKPSKGSVTYSYPKSKKEQSFHIPIKSIAFIFQHYHLLEEETSLFNVMLPALISGDSYNYALSKSKELLEKLGFDENTMNKKVSLLSGGEKERVAILRALVRNPKVILADEPTGALDSQNSIKTMDILKKASENRLVLVVTHNKELVKQYADRIINIEEGKVISDEIINDCDEEVFYPKPNKKTNNIWTETLIEHNFKKRIKRNIISCASLSLSLIFTLMMVGFVTNYQNRIDELCLKHLDYGSATISKESRREIEGSSVTLVKSSKLSKEDIGEINFSFPEFEILPSYDCILATSKAEINSKKIEDCYFSYVYDFDKNCIDSSLLLEGKIPSNTDKEILINKQCENFLKNLLQIDSILGMKITYSFEYENVVKFEGKNVVDFLEFSNEFLVTGVVDELEFLSTPKIYLSYSYFDLFFEENFPENLSYVKGEEITWKSLIENANENDVITSYSNKIFLRNILMNNSFNALMNKFDNIFSIENQSFEIKEALDSFIYAADLGLTIFLIIVIAGSALIMATFSYASFSDDKKNTAILSCLGAKYSDIAGIYIAESLFVGIMAFSIAIICSILLQNPLNILIYKLTSLDNMISIPIQTFLGRKFMLPLITLSCVSLFAILASGLPILLTKRVSIKEELSEA